MVRSLTQTNPFLIGAPTKVETPVKILFLPDQLEDRQIQTYFKDTTMGEGQVNGIMYKYPEFEPKLKDTIERDGVTMGVVAIDELRPINNSLLYFIEFAA